MKKISLSFLFLALFAVASFANNPVVPTTPTTNNSTEVQSTPQKDTQVDLVSCKVSVTAGGSVITVTSTCECTQVQACDAAYKAIRIFL